MSRVILLIGRLCAGKTTYARRIVQEENAVLLSCDELMRTVFPEPLGDRYDGYSLRCQAYLFQLAARLAHEGATPVLDFGFWTRASRQAVREALRGLSLDWRYLDVPDDEWRRRIASRNTAVKQGRANPDEYAVDAGLLAKMTARFEPPTPDECPGLVMVRDG